MTMRQLGSDTTSVHPDGTDLVWEREFDAPRETVWRAMTEADRVARWWGPRKFETEVVELDARPGGTWRFLNRNEDGEHPFTGTFIEVVPPDHFSWTFIYDVEPFNQGDPGTETFTFEELDGGRTRLTSRSHFPSVEVLEQQIAVGMIEGGIESWDRLAEELARM